MLWIVFGIGVLITLFTFVFSDFEEFFFAIGSILTLITLAIIGISYSCYNSIKTTAEDRLAVVQEQNEIVIKQIEPMVLHYAEYERNTYNDFKITPESIVALCSVYPELKTNELVNRQLDIIIRNQEEIKEIKLEIASLKQYHFWLWTEDK